jgi:membrane protein
MATAHAGTDSGAWGRRSADSQPRGGSKGAMQDIKGEARQIEGFGKRFYFKFTNDWTMNLVAILSYNVLISFFPLILAIITILSFVPSVTGNTHAVVDQINTILPSEVRSQLKIDSLINSVSSKFGLLTLFSILGLLWAGANLFGAIESAFAVIFRVKTRKFPDQKLMALAMIILFVILLPLSFISSFFVGAASTTLGKILPSALNGPLAVIISLAASLASLFVLFLAIYTVVPNIPIRWRNAWRGALVAAVAMWVINSIFPFYTSHFVGTKQYGAAAIGTAIITIVWFWFFSLILLIGAQINALVMGIGYWEYDLSRVLMEARIPTRGGAPTAVAALTTARDPEVTDAPFGLARDSQEIEDPAAHRKPEPGYRRPSSGGSAAGAGPDVRPSSDGGHHGNPLANLKDHAQEKARQFKAHHDAKSHAAPPHPAHLMDPDLVATAIAPGGVQMASPDDTLGTDPMRSGAIALGATLGAALGLVQGLRASRRRR